MSNNAHIIATAAHYTRLAADILTRIEDEQSTAYEAGFDAGVASAGSSRRVMSGAQFFARLMNCVSPESAAWQELHRLAESGFGRSIDISDAE